MTVSKQDAITLLLGLGAAVAYEVGLRLYQLDPDQSVDWSHLGAGLLIGTLSAVGRYLVTRVPEMLRGRRDG